MKLDVRLQVDSVVAVRREHERTVRKAAARGLNRAIDAAKTQGARAVSAATKIKVREVSKRMTITGANPDYLVASLEAHPYSPNLANFRATQNGKGVAATAWEGRKTYHHAFVNKRTGRVVTRTSDARLPLKGLKGPSVRKTFMRPEVLAKVEQAARERFTSEFEREVTRRLG